jgi:hypothetical protein
MKKLDLSVISETDSADSKTQTQKQVADIIEQSSEFV